MRENKTFSIKLRSISIKNYKGIKDLSIDFLKPKFSKDPDIWVMGSENGLGKTSIIECSTLILMCLSIKEEVIRLVGQNYLINVPNLIISSGANGSCIKGEVFINDDKKVEISIEIYRDGFLKITKSPYILAEKGDFVSIKDNNFFDNFNTLHEPFIHHFINDLFGFSINPMLENHFLLFHSYRKVQEGRVSLSNMVHNEPYPITIDQMLSNRIDLLNKLKLLVIRLLMNKANLFESLEIHNPNGEMEDSKEIMSKFDKLLKLYAGGTISKLRPFDDNTLELRVKLNNTNKSISFDGLSSGQKEIISTLFLIWYYTRKNSLVVLIDEPELHLNAKWHRTFINTLLEISPNNQYIIATHSEDIMDSVYKDRRILLLKNEEGTNG